MIMKGTILVTDSLFIHDEHIALINGAGFDVVRLDVPNASEAQLVEAVKGKIGYILGGIEKITETVIEAADELKVISFTGADWKQFIPAHAIAKEKGIVITNTPGVNTNAVAEYTLLLILAMVRNVFELGRTGHVKFQTTTSLNELTVGIVGMGHIGSRVAMLLKAHGVTKILYTSRTQKPEVEDSTGAKFVSLDELLSQSDVVTLHASKDIGENFIGSSELAQMKDGSLLINCGFTGGVDADALYTELTSGRLRAAQDDPFDEHFDTFPLQVWFNSNAHTAFNTYEANKKASNMATRSILNALAGVRDEYQIN
jgi:phosphoglycerate dehydrogenase-like enzyme